jgi:predicted O-linked N-acetylglucosamine transferase (SPINDLY family)
MDSLALAKELFLTALAHQERGELAAAEQLYRKALELAPTRPSITNNLAVVLLRSQRFAEAESLFKGLLSTSPGDATVIHNLGNCQLGLKATAEALAYFDMALAIKPDYVEALVGRSTALMHLDRLEEALASCNAAVAARPDLAEGHYGLGTTLMRLDRQREASQAFAQAIALQPDFGAARWAFTMAQLPAVCEAEADEERCRTAFSTELANLSHWFGSNSDHDPDAMALQPFYLAYQERDNRELLARYGKLSAEIMRRWSERQHLPREPPPKRSHVRVGIVSAHIFEHSVWTALIKGWVQHLDRGRFEVDIFHLGRAQDQETLFARSHASHFEQGAKGLRDWVDVILKRQPDVLIYPEFGMDGMSAKLGSLRLAPVQVASWGHPETSGLPTMDYYLSAEAFEPPGAQRYYAERLVTLPGSGSWCEESSVTAVKPDLDRLGIDSESPILICPGTPYKYAPQHDWIFPAIARLLGRCQFVFFVHPRAHLSEKLRRRLEGVFKRDGLVFEHYVVVIPWQPRAAFHGLLRRADLYLDTIGFSGFNTAMQAVANGLPIVTREGRFMRGRLASGLLKQVRLPELVAQSEEEYVATAARLVQDVEYSRQIRARIDGARASLFEDIAPIRTLEEFLSTSVARPS